MSGHYFRIKFDLYFAAFAKLRATAGHFIVTILRLFMPMTMLFQCHQYFANKINIYHRYAHIDARKHIYNILFFLLACITFFMARSSVSNNKNECNTIHSPHISRCLWFYGCELTTWIMCHDPTIGTPMLKQEQFRFNGVEI